MILLPFIENDFILLQVKVILSSCQWIWLYPSFNDNKFILLSVKVNFTILFSFHFFLMRMISFSFQCKIFSTLSWNDFIFLAVELILSTFSLKLNWIWCFLCLYTVYSHLVQCDIVHTLFNYIWSKSSLSRFSSLFLSIPSWLSIWSNWFVYLNNHLFIWLLLGVIFSSCNIAPPSSSSVTVANMLLFDLVDIIRPSR